MDPRIITIGRLLLIPIFIFLLVSVYHSTQYISGTRMGMASFERSVKENWPRTLATFNGPLVVWQANPPVKDAPTNVLPQYSYRAGKLVCQSNRFEFGPRKTDHTVLPAGDKRLAALIKQSCSGEPKKTVLKDRIQYDYVCSATLVFYDPKNVCVSYIAKPVKADTVRAALKKNIVMFNLMIAVKLLLAGLCVWGAWPLLATARQFATKRR